MRINPEKKEERERVALSLLRATLELAAAHGFSSLGLREVSRAAGIAPTSFYRHFADMEELGLALIESLVGRLVRDLSDAASVAPSGGALEAVVNRAFAAAAADPELFRFILAERVGAIRSFREALANRLGAISQVLRAAAAPERAGAPAAPTRYGDADADAVVLLVFDACGKMLDHGPERLSALQEQLRRQARLLLGSSTQASSAG